LTDIDERKRAEEKLQQQNVALREEIDKASMFEEIVGTSRSLKALLSEIAKVAPTDSTVLITGKPAQAKNSSPVPFTNDPKDLVVRSLA
jgi:transcriptional regulator with GAF, ATPase, and Fis domain